MAAARGRLSPCHGAGVSLSVWDLCGTVPGGGESAPAGLTTPRAAATHSDIVLCHSGHK